MPVLSVGVERYSELKGVKCGWGHFMLSGPWVNHGIRPAAMNSGTELFSIPGFDKIQKGLVCRFLGNLNHSPIEGMNEIVEVISLHGGQIH
jgi:hypothetical protein